MILQALFYAKPEIFVLKCKFNLKSFGSPPLKISGCATGLTESRIKNDPLTNTAIPKYNFFHVDSQSSAGGGAVYAADNFRCN